MTIVISINRQATLHYSKIDRKISKIPTGDIVISEIRQATWYYFKIDRILFFKATGDIAIFENRQAKLRSPIKAPIL